MLKEVPKGIVAKIPDNFRFYRVATEVVLVNTAWINPTWWKPGDVLMDEQNKMYGIFLGPHYNPTDECRRVVFYDDISETIMVIGSREKSAKEFFSKFNKVGHIDL